MVTTPAKQFPVKLGDRWFATDLSFFERAPLKSIAQSFDTSREPGEQSLGNEGVWKRSQFDFVHGAGQLRFDDDEEVDRRRFRFSLGCDIWTRGQVTALPLSTAVDSNVGNGDYAEMAVLGGTLFVAVSGSPATVRYSTDGSTWNNATGEPNITTGFSLVALGQYVYLSSGATLERATTSGAFAAFGSLTPDYLVVGADRLIGLEANSIYEIDNAGAKVGSANIYDHFDTTFAWKGGCYSPAGVYVFGDDGTRSSIQLMVPVDATTEFAPPFSVCELPEGELVRRVKFYGGVIVIATSLGVRLAQIGSNGSLIYGPLRELNDVLDLEVQKQFCWFTWTDMPGDALGLTQRSGLGRMGLDRFTDPLVPSYASDLITPSGSDTVRCCAWFKGKMYYGVDDGTNLDVYTAHASTKVPSMVLGVGAINFGIPEQKAVTSFEVRHSALAASQTVDLAGIYDYTTNAALGSQSATDGDTISRFVPSSAVEREYIDPYITVATNGAAFTLYRWTLRVLPMVRRAERIRLGIMLYTDVIENRSQVRFDPQAQFEYLLSLMNDRALVTLTMGDRSDTVYVDAVMVDQNQSQPLVDNWDGRGFINSIWLVDCLTNADA